MKKLFTDTEKHLILKIKELSCERVNLEHENKVLKDLSSTRSELTLLDELEEIKHKNKRLLIINSVLVLAHVLNLAVMLGWAVSWRTL